MQLFSSGKGYSGREMQAVYSLHYFEALRVARKMHYGVAYMHVIASVQCMQG